MPGTDEPLSGRQMPSSFDENHEFYNEKALQKIFRKLKEEPLIPLGSGLTVFAFVSAYRAIRRGDSQYANKMFRARVAAQGFTIIAMVAGGMYYSKDREATKELRKLKEAKDNEEKRQKWIRELEARDEEDKAMRAMLQDRRAKAAKTAEAAKQADAESGFEAEKKKSGGSVLGALGLSGWSKASEEEEERKAIEEKQAAEAAAVMAKIKPPKKSKTPAAGSEGQQEESK